MLRALAEWQSLTAQAGTSKDRMQPPEGGAL
jgi:hypothetical protein